MAIVFLVATFAGCSSGPKPSATGAQYVVVAPRTAFFRFGPNQNAGPDQIMDLGTRVTLVSREYGYSRFKLSDGRIGYMFNNDLTVAPPLPAPVLATPAPGRFASGRGGARRNRGPLPQPTSDPLFNISDVPLQMPEEGAGSSGSPRFRASGAAPR